VEFSNVEIREVDVLIQNNSPVASSLAVSDPLLSTVVLQHDVHQQDPVCSRSVEPLPLQRLCSSLQGGGQFSVHECPGSGQMIGCPEDFCQIGSQQGGG
jgi:hypothetical protein